MTNRIVKVIVESPLGPLDYLCGDVSDLKIGDRCLVPFGRRVTVGIVAEFSDKTDLDEKKLRKVLGKADEIAPMSENWMKLTKFAARYYLSSWGRSAVISLPKFFRTVPGKKHAASLANLRKIKETPKPKNPVLPPVLNEEQQKAVDEFKTEGFNVGLLFGVTGSGKTEVYLRLIQQVLDRDSEAQVLLMVPEINLTPQLVERIQNRFPNELTVRWNSSIAEGEKAKSWLAVHEGRARILVGTRLSVFASFKKLSLIIIDEENDTSFKSMEGIRYSGRDLAIKKAQLENIPILLGSATPSLETFAKGIQNQIQMFRLTKRATQEAQMPDLALIDLGKNKEVNGLTEESRKAITETLAKKEQVLVFLNRRGYAPVVTCNGCGWTSNCPHCASYAVYHKTTGRLTCHLCGWSVPLPTHCPKCGSVELMPIGKGTQKIEEEILRLWPEAKAARMDQDTTRRKGSAERLISQVHSGEVDILLGTQMIAKGHDFKKVSLVVILNSDAQLLSSDFRARERLFAVLLQVSGRSGRADVAGKVLLQTRYADDPLFKYLAKQDYEGFARQELEARKASLLPPYSSQALIVAEGKGIDEVLSFLGLIKKQALGLKNPKIRIYDPVPQTIARIQDIDRAQLLFEANNRVDLHNFLMALDEEIKAAKYSKYRWYFDVDPISF
ncbi:MAG: primosomal protein N' [Burkholderiales bacterium]|nr:primosomal protein N' [Burkholderiales bacterium]